MKLKSFIFSVLTSTIMFAQTGGQEIFQFLNIPASARQTALGGEIISLTNDINQPLWNPATIHTNLDRKISLNYTNYLSGINIGSITTAYKINKKAGILHAGIKYLNYGNMIQADENGNETGEFGASDIALSIGYAYKIASTDIYIGSNLKVLNSSIANYFSWGIATDFGVLYSPYNKAYTITFVARNLGTQITSYNGVREKLPLQIALGGSYQLENVPVKLYGTITNLQRWKIGVPNPSNYKSDLNGNIKEEKISSIDNFFRHTVVGAELFTNKKFNLRIGYNYRRNQELKLQNKRSFGGLSFGFGLKMKKITLDYAYSNIHSATNISTFTLQIDLNSH